MAKENLPGLKKTISGYLLEEDGKISKHSLLSIGAALSGVALAGAMQSHGAKAATQHTHSHISHTSHGAHSSGGGGK
jgi:hypothetical protein